MPWPYPWPGGRPSGTDGVGPASNATAPRPGDDALSFLAPGVAAETPILVAVGARIGWKAALARAVPVLGAAWTIYELWKWLDVNLPPNWSNIPSVKGWTAYHTCPPYRSPNHYKSFQYSPCGWAQMDTDGPWVDGPYNPNANEISTFRSDHKWLSAGPSRYQAYNRITIYTRNPGTKGAPPAWLVPVNLLLVPGHGTPLADPGPARWVPNVLPDVVLPGTPAEFPSPVPYEVQPDLGPYPDPLSEPKPPKVGPGEGSWVETAPGSGVWTRPSPVPGAPPDIVVQQPTDPDPNSPEPGEEDPDVDPAPETDPGLTRPPPWTGPWGPSRPGRNTKERKQRGNSQLMTLLWLASQATESLDIIDAFWGDLPPRFKTRHKGVYTNYSVKLGDIYRAWGSMSSHEAEEWLAAGAIHATIE